MKRIALLIIFAFIMFGGFIHSAVSATDNKIQEETNAESISDNPKDNLWCVTFQLVWNDFMDKYTNSKPVIFEGSNPPIADKLNERLYSADILDAKSYYKVQGVVSKSLKKKIEKAIYKQFKEKSDILNMINWNAKDSYLFYVMLVKNFTFLNAFDKLDSAPFNNSVEKVKFFGINTKSNKKLHKNVDVLFYNSPDEFAVKLNTKENEDVILFRTDRKDSFENLYSYIISDNSKSHSFSKHDILIIPNIKVDETISYDELCNKKIKGTNKMISQALQTIKFDMDNKGGKLKSEAAIVVMKMALVQPEENRYFVFNKPFVLFLKEQDKDKPYYAMHINNTKYLVKD